MEPRWELGVVMDGEKKLEFGGGSLAIWVVRVAVCRSCLLERQSILTRALRDLGKAATGPWRVKCTVTCLLGGPTARQAAHRGNLDRCACLKWGWP